MAGCGGRQVDPDRGPSPAAMRPYTAAGLMAEAGDHVEAARLYDDAAAADPESVVVWLSAADARAELEQWDAAVERARRARALAPRSARVADRLGALLVAAGRVDEAAALYAELADAQPTSGEAMAGQAAIAERQGDDAAAIEAWQVAVERDGQRAAWWLRLGQARERVGRHAAAAEALDRAATLDPALERLDARTLLLALEGGEIEVARRVAERLAGDARGPGAGSVAIATLMLRRGDKVAATEELEWVLSGHPEHPAARLMLGKLLLDVGRPAEARKQLERVAPGTRERADALRLLASLALADDEADRAVTLLGEARAAGASRPELIRTLAVALRQAGRIAEARSELTLAVAQWPDDPQLRFLLALMVHEMEGEDAALPYMQQVLGAAPGHAGALNYIGFTWADRGERLDEAERMIRAALAARPEDGAIADSLGWVLHRQGRHAEALEALDRAAALSPGVAEIEYHRAEVLRALGRRDEARAAYRSAIEAATDPAEKARYEAAAKRKGRR